MTWDEILSEAHNTTIKMLEQKYDGMTNGEVIVIILVVVVQVLSAK